VGFSERELSIITLGHIGFDVSDREDDSTMWIDKLYNSLEQEGHDDGLKIHNAFWLSYVSAQVWFLLFISQTWKLYHILITNISF